MTKIQRRTGCRDQANMPSVRKPLWTLARSSTICLPSLPTVDVAAGERFQFWYCCCWSSAICSTVKRLMSAENLHETKQQRCGKRPTQDGQDGVRPAQSRRRAGGVLRGASCEQQVRRQSDREQEDVLDEGDEGQGCQLVEPFGQALAQDRPAVVFFRPVSSFQRFDREQQVRTHSEKKPRRQVLPFSRSDQST